MFLLLYVFLGIGILVKCLESYVGEEGNGFDPFLSPLLCPNEILREFPPVAVTVAEMDPLLDDGVGLVRNLQCIRTVNAEIIVHNFRLHNEGYVLPDKETATDPAGLKRIGLLARKENTLIREYTFEDDDDGPSGATSGTKSESPKAAKKDKKLSHYYKPMVALRSIHGEGMCAKLFL